MQKEQQRVFLVSHKAYYRVKYSFKNGKIIRYKRVPLESIRVIHHGNGASMKHYYLLFTSIDEKEEVYRDLYFSEGIKGDFINLSGQEIITLIVDAIKQYHSEISSLKNLPELKEQETLVDRKKCFVVSKSSLLLPQKSVSTLEKSDF